LITRNGIWKGKDKGVGGEGGMNKREIWEEGGRKKENKRGKEIRKEIRK
jgi:hypothetical protein